MESNLRAAAAALDRLVANARDWSDRSDAPADQRPAVGSVEFAGVDIVGIDFSTSIRAVAHHVITGWARYRLQVEALRPDHGVWAFGVNATPFPLTRRPEPPGRLPQFTPDHFLRRGLGRGLVEYGSAFFDYLMVALGHAYQVGVFDDPRPAVPVTIGLLCDGWPNGGTYRAADVRPLVGAARARGVRFKVVTFNQVKYGPGMWQFGESIGLTDGELEVVYHDDAVPDGHSIHSGFETLSSF